MENLYVKFPEELNIFEKQQNWRGAVDYLYDRWRENPYDLNNMLCVALEVWYVFLECQYNREHCFTCTSKNLDEQENGDILLKKLWETYDWGEWHFKENATYNAYMGYIIQYRPMFWFRNHSEYDWWLNKGCEMVKKAHKAYPDNLLY